MGGDVFRASGRHAEADDESVELRRERLGLLQKGRVASGEGCEACCRHPAGLEADPDLVLEELTNLVEDLLFKDA